MWIYARESQWYGYQMSIVWFEGSGGRWKTEQFLGKFIPPSRKYQSRWVCRHTGCVNYSVKHDVPTIKLAEGVAALMFREFVENSTLFSDIANWNDFNRRHEFCIRKLHLELPLFIHAAVEISRIIIVIYVINLECTYSSLASQKERRKWRWNISTSMWVLFSHRSFLLVLIAVRCEIPAQLLKIYWNEEFYNF